MAAMSQSLSELFRLLHNLLCLGTITEVDHAGRRVKLDLSGRATGWLPYPAEIGANFIRWRPLRAGIQVLAACPSGDPANAIIVQILYTDALPPPETGADVDVIRFGDGTTIRHDSAAHRTTISNPDGTLVLEAKNLVLRVLEEGTYHFDHAGKAIRVTHQGGDAFESEAWETGSIVTPQPDNGYSPPRVTIPEEGGAA